MLNSGTILATGQFLPSSGIFSTITNLYVISAIAFGGSLCVAGVADQKLIHLLTSIKVFGVMAIAVCISTILPVYFADTPAATLCDVICGIITGIGTCVLTLAWGTMLSRRHTYDIVLYSAFGVMGGFILYCLIFFAASTKLRVWIVAFLPLIEAVLLKFQYPKPFNIAGGEPFFTAFYNNKAGFYVSLIIPVTCLGITLGVFRLQAIQTSTLQALDPASFLLVCLIPSALLVGFSSIMPIRHIKRWSILFKLYIPMIAFTMAVIGTAYADYPMLSNIAAISGWVFLECLMWSLFGFIAHIFRLSPVAVFGIGRGVLALASIVVTLFLTFLFHSDSSNGQFLAIITAMLFLLIGSLMIPDEPTISRYIRQCPVVPFLSLDEFNAFPWEKPFQTSQSSLRHSPRENSEKPADSPDAEIQDAVRGSSLASPPPSSQTATKDTDINQSAYDNVQQTSQALNNGMLSADNKNKTNDHSKGKFAKKLYHVAETYKLTDRETDILFELAKGHSPTYIQKELNISNGTVKTHIRHIYRKMDIHKRQDIYTRIEEIEKYYDDK